MAFDVDNFEIIVFKIRVNQLMQYCEILLGS